MNGGRGSPNGSDIGLSFVFISETSRPVERIHLPHGKKMPEDVLLALRLTEGKLKIYDTITKKFEYYFVPKPYIINKKAMFNMRKQEPVLGGGCIYHRSPQARRYL